MFYGNRIKEKSYIYICVCVCVYVCISLMFLHQGAGLAALTMPFSYKHCGPDIKIFKHINLLLP